MSRHNMTNVDSGEGRRELSPAQQRGVDLFAAGMSVTAVAAGLGVSRQTASEWLNQDPIFRASLNARRAELWVGASDALRSLMAKAIEALSEEMRPGGPDRLKAALATLRLTIGTAGLAPNGPTDPREVEAVDQEAAVELARRHGFALAGI
jgi:hypothetical protein